MGIIKKTDKLDAQGMNRLQRTGPLPVVWIPSGALRDKRDLPRVRMVFTQQRTLLKNRGIHATLAIHGTPHTQGRPEVWLWMLFRLPWPKKGLDAIDGAMQVYAYH